MGGFPIGSRVPPPPDPSAGAPRHWSQHRTTSRMAPPPPSQPSAAQRRSDYPAWLVWLARTEMLLPHQMYGLTPTAFKNIATASILLCVLWAMDFVAWTGLFNLGFTGELRQVSAGSAGALLMGVLFATGIMFYESQFLSSTFRRSHYPWVAVSVRAVLIFAAAAATSLPVDMFLLDAQINKRVHEEAVLSELPKLVQKWKDAREVTQAQGPVVDAEIKAKSVPQSEALGNAKDAVATADDAVQQASREFYIKRNAVAHLQNTLSQPNLSDPERQSLTTELARAHSELNGAQQRLNQAQDRLKQATAGKNQAQLALDSTVANNRLEIVERGAGEQTRYRDWIQSLWNAPPLEVVPEHTKQPDPQTYDGRGLETGQGIGQRIKILNDLLAGRPPRQPRFSEDDRAALAEMGLESYVAEDAKAEAQDQADAAALRRLAISFMIVFTIVPLLIFALKGFFDIDTRNYFDTEYQRLIGNPNLPPAPPPVPEAEIAGI